MTPVLCPICTRSTLEPILQHIHISAQIDGDSEIGALLAFRCSEFGHVFFVRKIDVEDDAELRYSV